MSNRWLVLAIAFLARMTLPVQFQCLAPVLPLFVEELHITYAEAGLLIGLFWLPGVALALPGGIIGSRFGDKQVIVGALACMTAGGVLLGGSTSFAVAVAGRLLSGAGAVVLNVQLTKIVTDHFAGREISTALGILLTSWPLGIAVTMSTLGFAATATSWHAAVYTTAGLSALALVLMASLYRVPSAGPAACPTLWDITRRELVLVTAAGSVWMFFNVSFAVVTTFTPLLLISRGYPLEEASAVASLLSWASLAAVPLGGYLADRIGRTNWMIAGGALASGLAAILLVPPGPAVPWILLFGVLGSLAPGSIMALPSAVLRPAARSAGLGVFYTFYYAGMVLFPPLAGWAHDATGTAAAAVMVGGVCRLLVAAALAGFRVLQQRAPG